MLGIVILENGGIRGGAMTVEDIAAKMKAKDPDMDTASAKGGKSLLWRLKKTLTLGPIEGMPYLTYEENPHFLDKSTYHWAHVFQSILYISLDHFPSVRAAIHRL